jgi:hypothetical protein
MNVDTWQFKADTYLKKRSYQSSSEVHSENFLVNRK